MTLERTCFVLKSKPFRSKNMISNKFLNKMKNQITSSFRKEKIKMVPVDELKFDDEYKGLFEQESDKVQRIANDMMKNGFDYSQPIIITADKEILDGNSRCLATKQAGIKFVPVIVKEFKSKDESLMYELHLQMDRRNLTDAQKFAAFKKLEELKSKVKESGESAREFTDERMAEQLKVSPRQISKFREVEKKATPELQQKILEGNATINSIHSEMKRTKKEDVDKKILKPAKSESNIFNKDSFVQGIKFALLESSKGKTVSEILNDKRLTSHTSTFAFTTAELKNLELLMTSVDLKQEI